MPRMTKSRTWTVVSRATKIRRVASDEAIGTPRAIPKVRETSRSSCHQKRWIRKLLKNARKSETTHRQQAKEAGSA